MIKSAVTISLVSSLRGGPWILWDDLPTSCRKAAELGFDGVELFTEGAAAEGLDSILQETGLGLAAVGTGAGKVVHGLTLTDPDAAVRNKAQDFIDQSAVAVCYRPMNVPVLRDLVDQALRQCAGADAYSRKH